MVDVLAQLSKWGGYFLENVPYKQNLKSHF